MTVLVLKKGKLSSITLCDFTEKSESDYRELADYAFTFTSILAILGHISLILDLSVIEKETNLVY